MFPHFQSSVAAVKHLKTTDRFKAGLPLVCQMPRRPKSQLVPLAIQRAIRLAGKRISCSAGRRFRIRRSRFRGGTFGSTSCPTSPAPSSAAAAAPGTSSPPPSVTTTRSITMVQGLVTCPQDWVNGADFRPEAQAYLQSVEQVPEGFPGHDGALLPAESELQCTGTR